MKWSILILTQPSRGAFLKRLQDRLMPQVKKRTSVQVLQRMFDPALDLGSNRQALLEEAEGDYVNFIDDDDLVPSDFVPTILPLLDGVDYIGFQLQCSIDGEKLPLTIHSLDYDGWSQDDKGYYRDISHINPIRRELALRAKMEGGFGEDQRWADRMRALGIVKTQHFIERIMYEYLYRSNKSETNPPSSPTRAFLTETPSENCPVCNATCVVLCGHGKGSGKRCTQCGYAF
jgi:hypothetical protein